MNKKECKKYLKQSYLILSIKDSFIDKLGSGLVIKNGATVKTSSVLQIELKVQQLLFKTVFLYWLAFGKNSLTILLTFSKQTSLYCYCHAKDRAVCYVHISMPLTKVPFPIALEPHCSIKLPCIPEECLKCDQCKL